MKRRKRLPRDVFDTFTTSVGLEADCWAKKANTRGRTFATLKRRFLPKRTKIRAKNWPVSSLYYIAIDRARGASWLLG